LGFGRQLLGHQTINQGDVLESAASVVFEQVAQNQAAGGFNRSPDPHIEPDGLRRARRSR
jgi:hypothetical protein